jgi:hypothetical protein
MSSMPPTLRLRLAPGLLAFSFACAPSSPPPSPSPIPPSEPTPELTLTSVTAPGSESLGLQATAVDCSWGSVGPVAIDAPIPYWVMATLDLETARDTTGVKLVELELFDTDGRSLGRADRELELRVTPPGATLYTSTYLPFGGTITAGHPLRLLVRARMEDAFADRVASPPASHRITLSTDAGAIIRVAGQVGGPWPTA